VVICHDSGALDEHQELPREALRIVGSGEDGDVGQQRKVTIKVAGGYRAGGTGVVLVSPR
jgi:hypothetical protein